MFLRNLPIKLKLLIMLVLPLLGILVFSGTIIFNRVMDVVQSEQLIDDTELFAQIGAVTHNLQKERGSTVGFVSSKGAKMADKVPVIRVDTDQTLIPLTKNLQARFVSGHKELQSALEMLEKLTPLRRNADAFALDGANCAAQYTGIIQTLLQLTNEISKNSKNTEIMRGASVYSLYMSMKERAGRERAILSGIFAVDKLEQANLIRAAKNVGEAQANLEHFLQLATPEQIEFHKQTVTGKAVDEVEALLKKGLNAQLNEPIGIESAYWFNLSTQRIDLMKKVEDKLVGDLIVSAKNIKNTALTTLIIISLIVAFVIFLTFILISKVTHAITEPLNLMRETIIQANNTGDYSKKLTYFSADEIGETAVAFNAMMDTLQSALSNVNKVMQSISRGEFNVRVEANVNGDLDQLKQNVNETVGQLRITMFALNDVMNSLYNADFAKVIVANVKGNFKNMIDKAIHSQEALRTMLGDISSVMEHLAEGDLNYRVTAEGRGELLALKEHINSTLASLECLNDIERVSKALAQGDLTQSISTNYPGVFGSVTVSMNNTAQHLKALIGEVHVAAQTINTAAKEIAAGNNDLSHRTEEQAASLEETAASMQELTGTVQQNNAHAEDANKMANDAAGFATRGVTVMNSVVETMEEINTSSHRIVDIITVIDDIAFQTNILALNAAVEAARAGESGKGFAVVAVEVRNLAQRAANAAGEIKRLIDDSVERISGGSRQVEHAGQTMQEIVDSIRNVSAIINEITTASEDQTAGISQVNQAIRQMDDVTQQNAALVEQAAAAAESLEEQTRDLSKALNSFKVR